MKKFLIVLILSGLGLGTMASPAWQQDTTRKHQKKQMPAKKQKRDTTRKDTIRKDTIRKDTTRKPPVLPPRS